jgi:hypothetical protein
LKLPEVTAFGLFGVTYSLYATDVGAPGQFTTFPAANDALDRTVDRLRITKGRHVDPTNAHEVVISAAAERQLHLHIGQHFTLRGAAPQQDDGAPPVGPKVRVRIVGIVAHDSLWARYLGSSDRVDDPTMIGFQTSPALVDHFSFGYAPNALVRLRHGAADVPAFRRGVARLTRNLPYPVPVRDLTRDRARFQRAIRVEQTALVLFALAVSAAGIVLLGQALVRLVQSSTDDAVSMSALGGTRGQIAVAAAAPSAVVVATAAVVAVVTAVVASPRFPIGLARSVDLDLGIHLDPLVTLLGLVALAVLVALGAFAASSRLLLPAKVPSGATLTSRLLGRLHLPLPAELGARMALQRGRGRHAVSVRPALVAAMAGVLGIVGAFTFRAGLDGAIDNVDLAGTTWQRVAYTDPGGSVATLPSLRHVPGLQAAAIVDRTAVDLDGDSVSMWSFRPLEGRLRRVATDGRLPKAGGEATVGWTTARRHHLHVGDSTVIDGHRVHVVGLGFLPEQEGHSAYDEGMWVTPTTFAHVVGSEPPEDREVLADFRGLRLHAPPTVAELSGSDPASRALAAALGDQVQFLEPATAPTAMSNLSSVRGLPLSLGVFLVLLAIGALAHSLVSSVSRRRGDLAVMAAIGSTPGQTRAMVAVHATVVAVVGLVVGVPLGILVGRSGWRWVADTVPFIYVGPLAIVVALGVVPAALVAAKHIAAAPARTAARHHPPEILRSE